jgi:hypothetical protein
VLADVRALPFRRRSVAEVQAIALLEHFADPYQVLDEIHRIITPQARVCFAVPALGTSSAHLDPDHHFLAGLKLWHQLLGGDHRSVQVRPLGVSLQQATGRPAPSARPGPAPVRPCPSPGLPLPTPAPARTALHFLAAGRALRVVPRTYALSILSGATPVRKHALARIPPGRADPHRALSRQHPIFTASSRPTRYTRAGDAP